MTGRFTALSENPEVPPRSKRRRARKRSPRKNSRFDALQADHETARNSIEVPNDYDLQKVHGLSEDCDLPKDCDTTELQNSMQETVGSCPKVAIESNNFDYTAALSCEAQMVCKKPALRPGHVTLPLSADNREKILGKIREIQLQADASEMRYMREVIQRCQRKERILREQDGEIFYPDELGFEYEDWDVDDSDDDSYGKHEYNDWICERKR